MKNIATIITLTLSTSLFFACDKNGSAPSDDVTVIQATGDIQDDVASFKNSLGPLNTTPNATGGHREINWDAVPDSLLDKPLPEDFFNPTSSNVSAALQRGITYSPGQFVVSSNNFATINADASSEFSSFSGNNAFANTAVARWDVKFQKAGTTQAASVQAFGLVFSDVDEDNSTSVEFFDGDKSIGKFFVPSHDITTNFSFLGVHFKNKERITKVTVTHDGFLEEGTKDVSQGGPRDLVVLDDFIYSEPVAQ